MDRSRQLSFKRLKNKQEEEEKRTNFKMPQYPPEKIREWKDGFTKFDRNHDGLFSNEERFLNVFD